MIAKLKTRGTQNRTVIPCKVDTDSDGIMPYHILKILISRESRDQLVAYNKPTTKQQFHN